MKFQSLLWSSLNLLLLSIATATASDAPKPPGRDDLDKTPQYYPLPSLREQAKIQDAWTTERRAKIPALLQKHGVDAWLVTCTPTLSRIVLC